MFKVDKIREDICVVLHKLYVCCHWAAWHTIYFASIYILCARSDGRPWSQNCNIAVNQFHRSQITAPNGPKLSMSCVLWGSSMNHNLEIRVCSFSRMSKSSNVTQILHEHEHIGKQQLFTALHIHSKTSTWIRWRCHQRLSDYHGRFSHKHMHARSDEPPLTLTKATLLIV